jgi:hypothetical protein
MTDAWLGLVGVLIGAGVTLLATRWQATRDDERQRKAERRATYALVHTAAEQTYHAVRAHVRTDDPERAGKVSAAIEKVMLAYGDLPFVATLNTINLAGQVIDRLMELAMLANVPGQLVKSGDPWVEGGRLEVAAAAYREALDAFVWASRRDLGITP